jgi:hypothetical protein
MGKYFTALLALMLTACSGLKTEMKAISNKTIIGQIEDIYVDEAKNSYKARIDTGAATTSINAQMLRIKGGSKDPSKNIGKKIIFDTYNAEKKKTTIEATIIDVRRVTNSQGEEKRYMVELSLTYKGKTKKIGVNLRDRSKMEYKLLIGRNWLKGDYVVDVSKENKTEGK